MGEQREDKQAAKRSTAGPILALLLVSVVLAACVRGFDARLVNPCEEAVRVVTHSRPTETATGEGTAEASVPPLDVTDIEDAFHTANGFSWSVAVELPGEAAYLFPVDGTKLRERGGVVAIPAAACSAKP